jgi:uncharacterized protein YcaQ
MDSGSAQQIDWPEQQRRSDDMTRKHAAGGKAVHVAGGWKASPAAVLKRHNGARHDGAVASFATQDKRADVLYAGFKRLHELNYRMETVTPRPVRLSRSQPRSVERAARAWRALVR